MARTILGILISTNVQPQVQPNVINPAYSLSE